MNRWLQLAAVILLAIFAGAAAVQTVRLHQARHAFDRAAPYLPSDWEARALAAESGGSLPEPEEASSDSGTAKADSEVIARSDSKPEDPEKEAMERIVNEAIDSMMSGNSDTAGKRKNAGKAPGNATKTEPGQNAKPKNGEKDRDETARSKAADQSRQFMNRARDAMQSGDFEKAAELYAKSIEADPGNKQAYRSLAQMQHGLGLFEDEIQTYKNWMSALPSEALPHYLLAATYTGMGLDAEAYQELTQFQSLSDAGDLASYSMAASMLRRLGMRAEEGNALQSWANAAPDSPDAHRALGDYYRRMGDYTSAISEYQSVASLVPNNVAAYSNLGSLYNRLGMYAQAQSQYLSALELRPDNLGLRVQLADSYRVSGDAASAIDMYQSVIDLEPGSSQAQQAQRYINRLQRQLAQ